MKAELKWLRSQQHYKNSSPEDQASMELWQGMRPLAIQRAIMKRPPWFPYRIKGAGNSYGWIYCYEENEDGPVTCKINITEETWFPRQVFGVALDDLEEVQRD